MKGGWVYVLTNKPFGLLYIGVTNDLAARMTAHRDGRGSIYAFKRNLDKLVLAEPYPTVGEAIVREKRLKEWRRAWKLRLIAEANPTWEDLSQLFNA